MKYDIQAMFHLTVKRFIPTAIEYLVLNAKDQI
jgi:hypothetical protein